MMKRKIFERVAYGSSLWQTTRDTATREVSVDPDANMFRPPYLSFQTFWKFIEELASKPLPPAVDRSIMTSKSGTDQANLIMALTSFGLTDAQGNVQPALTALIDETPADERKRAFGGLLRQYYVGPLRVSAQNGTPGDLNKVFMEDYPSIASSDTRRKSVTFFLHAARGAGIELSPHFPSTRSGSGAPGTAKARRSPTRRRMTAESSNSASKTVDGAPKQAAAGHTLIITLKSGGTVTLNYDVDLFQVDDDDEGFVLSLVKKLRRYQTGSPIATQEEEDEQ